VINVTFLTGVLSLIPIGLVGYVCDNKRQLVMKAISKLTLLIALTISLVGAYAQEGYSVKDVEMKIEGTSTLHDWVSDVTKVKADAKLTFEGQRLKGIQSLYVSIPVKSIESTKGRIMDNKTYDALKSDRHPNITFKLKNATVTPTGMNSVRVNATGALTIAGTTRTVQLVATGKAGSGNTITFSGSKKLLMSDYNMEQPTALMGTIETGNEVTIRYSLELSANSQEASRF
jgi:polyisoprenoid-binding protein YceI